MAGTVDDIGEKDEVVILAERGIKAAGVAGDRGGEERLDRTSPGITEENETVGWKLTAGSVDIVMELDVADGSVVAMVTELDVNTGTKFLVN